MTDPNGLLYMRARYYNPYLCRFLNPDPSGFRGGLNMYAAFNGNPVSYSDPTGMVAVGDNQNLSWLTGASATPANLSNPFNLPTEQPDWFDRSLDVANNVYQTMYPPPEVEAQKPAWQQAIDRMGQFVLAVGLPEAGGPEMMAVEETGAANTFYHYTQAEIQAGQGLNVGSGVTSVGNLNASEAMFKLGIEPPTYVYPVNLANPASYLIQDVGIPARNQISAWRVIQPTPPGSVGLPIPVPPAP